MKTKVKKKLQVSMKPMDYFKMKHEKEKLKNLPRKRDLQ